MFNFHNYTPQLKNFVPNNPLKSKNINCGSCGLKNLITYFSCDECGTPCQKCRHRCEYQAITPAGAITYSECFQCLDCVAIYQDDERCLPLIQERKTGSRIITITEVGRT